jgi:hypothetical protein
MKKEKEKEKEKGNENEYNSYQHHFTPTVLCIVGKMYVLVSGTTTTFNAGRISENK